jgi:branched-subunit amino acid transport protein
MSTVDIWITIFWLTVATIVTRGAFFMIGHVVKLPPKVQHALRYAPAAALAATVVPDLVTADGNLSTSWANPKLMAGIGAVVFFLLTRHLLWTIVVGMALFSLLRIYA